MGFRISVSPIELYCQELRAEREIKPGSLQRKKNGVPVKCTELARETKNSSEVGITFELAALCYNTHISALHWCQRNTQRTNFTPSFPTHIASISPILCLFNCVRWNHGMARPQIADEGDGLQGCSEYSERSIANSRQWVVLQFMCYAEG
jgi:hypothetical protein